MKMKYTVKLPSAEDFHVSVLGISNRTEPRETYDKVKPCLGNRRYNK